MCKSAEPASSLIFIPYFTACSRRPVQTLQPVHVSWKRNGNKPIKPSSASVRGRNPRPPEMNDLAPRLRANWHLAGPCQPSMVFRYLRTLEGVSPPLSLTHLSCQTTAKSFVASRESALRYLSRCVFVRSAYRCVFALSILRITVCARDYLSNHCTHSVRPHVLPRRARQRDGHSSTRGACPRRRGQCAFRSSPPFPLLLAAQRNHAAQQAFSRAGIAISISLLNWGCGDLCVLPARFCIHIYPFGFRAAAFRPLFLRFLLSHSDGRPRDGSMCVRVRI